MKNSITYSLLESIDSSNIVDLSVDYSELALDTIVENPLMKELPIIKTIRAIYKAGVSIRERFLIKKTLVFIQTFNTSGISKTEFEKYKNRLNDNPKKASKELEHIVILLDRQAEYIKGAILANLYSSFIRERIKWNIFSVFGTILDDLSTYDLDYFRLFYPKKAYSAFSDMDKIDNLAVARLSRNDLVNFTDPTHGISVPILDDGSEGDVNILTLTKTGELFYTEGMKNISLERFDFFKSGL